MFRQGIDTPLFAVLRDNRPKQLNDKILAIFETNLHEAPVYINNYPNYSLSLKSFHETQYNVFFDIKMKDENWNPRAIPITIIYHLYYKVMKTQLAPQALLISLKEETTILLVNPEKVNASVPRKLRHDEITSGLKWRLEDIISLTPPTLNEVDTITEYKSGAVEITFAPLRENLRRVRSVASYFTNFCANYIYEQFTKSVLILQIALPVSIFFTVSVFSFSFIVSGSHDY